jgi:type IV secretory pathway protease TraF
MPSEPTQTEAPRKSLPWNGLLISAERWPANIFVLGDNPANSLNSRFHGPVPRRAITGKVWLIVP